MNAASISTELAQVERQIDALQKRKRQLLTQLKPNSPKTPVKSLPKIVVVGGRGQLGRRFVDWFSQSSYPVVTLDQDDWDDADTILLDAKLVLIAVPIHLTLAVIAQLPVLSSDCILADITSIKSSPLEAMLAAHSGPVVGLHPMFGPDVIDLLGQTLVVCDGRESLNCQWLLDQFVEWGAQLQRVSAAEHDSTMAIVQVLRHFSTIVYGHHLAEERVQLETILAMSSPIYRLELMMVGRLFAQDPDLYTEIIFANPDNWAMMQRFVRRFDNLLNLVAEGDKAAFKLAFTKTRQWFGDYAERFLKESGQMLAAAKQAHAFNSGAVD